MNHAPATRLTFLAGLTGLALTLALSLAGTAQAATPVASYHFANSLAADQAGAPALQALDPLAANGFETALVGGIVQTVYRWAGDGNASSQQGGLQLAAGGLLADLQSYTLTMSFEFSSLASTGGGWRRLVDTQARQSDNGFYISPEQRLQLVQGTDTGASALTSGNTLFSTPGFHQLLLSVARAPGGGQQVQAWLDGVLEFSTSAQTVGLDGSDNPGHGLVLFADNLAAGAQQEYANGRIASLALYDGALTPSTVPEPAAAGLLATGLLVLGWRRRAARLTCP